MSENRVALPKGGITLVFLASLRGISQVIFIENAVSGFIILLAITIASFPLGIIAFLSSMIGFLVAKIGGANENSICTGIYGYNSVLTGMAIALFLTGPSKWIIALVGAAIATIFYSMMMHFMKNVALPILTLPFIILTWFLLLASYRLKVIHLSESLVPQSLSHWELNIKGEIDWTEGIFDGIGQIFFLDYALSGALMYIAVFWAGWKLGVYAVIGNAFALLMAYGLGAEHSLILIGLYGYNAILTCIAVTTVYGTSSNRFRVVTGIVAASLTVPLAGSISTWLLPYGLPPLTLPFVFSTWLFLGARKVLPNL